MSYSKENLPEVKKCGSDLLFLNCMDMNGTALMAVESRSQAEFEVWRELSLLFMLQGFLFASLHQIKKVIPVELDYNLIIQKYRY